MKLLRAYGKHRLGCILVCALLCAVFAVTAALGGLSGGIIAYGLLLCAALGLVAGAVDFARFSRRYRQLNLAREQLTLSLEHLPKASDPIEEKYQELLNCLFQAERAARSANERRGRELTETFSLWAHQIKTPIAAMDLILQTEPGEQNAELEQELLQIEQYVEMALNMLRLDSDSTDYVLRRCEIDAIIRGAVRKYAAQFIRRRITLDYAGTALCAVTDEKWLGFVVEQLLANALKYTREGSIRIYTEDNRLVIADTGIGIAAEDLPRVFEKGYTGYNGRRDLKSTGLGLYLCKQILDRLGHEIRIESTVGVGTRVTVSLNLTEM